MGIPPIRRTCEQLRSHAQKSNASHVLRPYVAQYESPQTTTLRTNTHGK